MTCGRCKKTRRKTNWLTAIPCDEASRIPPQARQIALRRRLRLPLLFAPAAAAPTQDVVVPWTLTAEDLTSSSFHARRSNDVRMARAAASGITCSASGRKELRPPRGGLAGCWGMLAWGRRAAGRREPGAGACRSIRAPPSSQGPRAPVATVGASPGRRGFVSSSRKPAFGSAVGQLPCRQEKGFRKKTT